MGGDGGSSTGTYTMRYSQVVEENYRALLWYVLGDDGRVPMTVNEQPYSLANMGDFNEAFKDLHVNYFKPFIFQDQFYGLEVIQKRFINNDVVNSQIAAHNQYLEDDINQNILPKLSAGLRDIGAVMSSSFLDAKALVEANRVKTLSKYSAELKMKMFDVGYDVWKQWWDWNWKIVNYQVNIIDLYYKIGSNYTKLYNDVSVGNTLFPWTVLDQARAIVGALNGAQAARSGKETMSMSGIQATAAYVGMGASMASMAGSLFGGGGGGSALDGVANVG